MKILIFTFLLLLLMFLAYLFYKKNSDIKNKYKLLDTRNIGFLRLVFLFLSFFVLILSLLDFKIDGEKLDKSEEWVDIVFVLDVSKSMNVADFTDDYYSYSRLDIAKGMISSFVSSNPWNRYWLTIFAWDAISVVPITYDKDVFLTLLSWVDYKNLSIQWSNFEKAISSWVDRFWDDDRARVMILLSDWWDEGEDLDYSYIKNSIKDLKISSFIFWVWTESGWKIPDRRDVFWTITYQKYKNQFVVSKLNQDNLKSIANSLWWEYFRADSISLLEKYIDSMDKKIIESDENIFEEINASRKLSFLAFFFFFLYIIFPLLTPRKTIWK